jgi:hypothetical protein
MEDNEFGEFFRIWHAGSCKDRLPEYVEIRKLTGKLVLDNGSSHPLYQWWVPKGKGPAYNGNTYSNGLFLSEEAAARDIYDWFQDNP